jgi:hypothetical protein
MQLSFLLAALSAAGGGKYKGVFAVAMGNSPSITLKSSLGGTITDSVPLK